MSGWGWIPKCNKFSGRDFISSASSSSRLEKKFPYKRLQKDYVIHCLGSYSDWQQMTGKDKKERASVSSSICPQYTSVFTNHGLFEQKMTSFYSADLLHFFFCRYDSFYLEIINDFKKVFLPLSAVTARCFSVADIFTREMVSRYDWNWTSW